MNTEKYKSIVVSKELHSMIVELADRNDRAISKTLSRLIEKGLSAEAELVNLDSQLVKGGTPRIHRLLQDLLWLEENTEDGLSKKYVIDVMEKHAIGVVIGMLNDIISEQ